MKKEVKLPFISQCFLEFSKEFWDEIFLDDDYWYAGFIVFKNWKKSFFVDTIFDINNSWATRIAKDKSYTKYFLEKFWYKVPLWDVFFSDELNIKLSLKKTIDDWYDFVKKLWFPLIVKPNNLSQWKFVWKVYNKSEYYSLAKKILKVTDVMLVEKFCVWKDYRIVVLNGEVKLCYERKSLEITWDWKKNILKLIEEKNIKLKNIWSNARINLEKTNIAKILKRKWLTLKSILKDWEKIKLLDNANLSTWWELIDFTDKIHESFKKIAINITKDIWLKYSWIDIITDDITKEAKDYYVLEVNSSPWFNNYLLASENNLKLAKNLCLDIYREMWKINF